MAVHFAFPYMNEGTFLGKYETKLKEFQNAIDACTNETDRVVVERAMHTYITDCFPYINEYCEDVTEHPHMSNSDEASIIAPYASPHFEHEEVFRYRATPCDACTSSLPVTETKRVSVGAVQTNLKPVCERRATGVKRWAIHRRYMNEVEDGNHVVHHDRLSSTKSTTTNIVCSKRRRNARAYANMVCDNTNPVCAACNKDTIVTDNARSEVVCTNCGISHTYLGQELNYKDQLELSSKVTYNGYKKENHLNEWIMQFQGKENVNIPEEIFDKLRCELKKQKVQNVKDISREKVKALLKKLKLNKYYENVTHITHVLNGQDTPHMSKELEDRLKYMFREIQQPFQDHCPPSRNNFLSYSYVLYKFCELLEEDEYLPYFPLLKAKDKLQQQDAIWRNICRDMQWEFIPTS